MSSHPQTHPSSGGVEENLNLEAWFQADYYKPFFSGTQGSQVKHLDYSKGLPNTENSTILKCTQTVSLRVTRDPHYRDLWILDFVNAKNPKEKVGKPAGLEVCVCLDYGERCTLEPFGVWISKDVHSEVFHLSFSGLYEVYLNGECVSNVAFEHKPISV